MTIIIIDNIIMSANDNQCQFEVEQEKRMSQEERLNEVIRQLRADKRRITNQRKLLLSIILRHEYSSCKEIYYEAKKQDSTLGIATVYRTVQLLEDMELIRKEMRVQI